MTEGQVVILTEPWWNSAAQEQAFGRVFRIGQKKPTEFHLFIVSNSIEFRMYSIQKRKDKEITPLMERSGHSELSTTDYIIESFGFDAKDFNGSATHYGMFSKRQQRKPQKTHERKAVFQLDADEDVNEHPGANDDDEDPQNDVLKDGAIQINDDEDDEDDIVTRELGSFNAQFSGLDRIEPSHTPSTKSPAAHDESLFVPGEQRGESPATDAEVSEVKQRKVSSNNEVVVLNDDDDGDATADAPIKPEIIDLDDDDRISEHETTTLDDADGDSELKTCRKSKLNPLRAMIPPLETSRNLRPDGHSSDHTPSSKTTAVLEVDL